MDQDFFVLKEGLRFECQGSGKCCFSRGQYGYVYLNQKDRKRMAQELGMATSAFTRKFCEKTEGYYHLKADSKQDECLFLKDKKCTIYQGRPTQCRTWPFWPEVMNAKAWKNEVANFCPGVGRGRYYGPGEIKEIIEWQKRSENES